MTRVDQLDKTKFVEAVQGAADGFEGDAKMVSDVGARHEDIGRVGALWRQFDEKISHALVSAEATEPQLNAFALGQFFRQRAQDRRADLWVAIKRGIDRRRAENDDIALRHSLGGMALHAQQTEPDQTPRAGEAADVTPAIDGEPKTAHETGYDADHLPIGFAFERNVLTRRHRADDVRDQRLKLIEWRGVRRWRRTSIPLTKEFKRIA